MNLEIAEQKMGKFETPEQLAQALDAKNKTLADKIRAVEANRIKSESGDWREVLRKELSETEEYEVRQAINTPEIDVFFDEGMTPEQKQTARIDVAARSVAPGIAPLLEKGKKVEGYFQKVSKSWDKAGELWDKGEYIQAIKVFFLGLFGKSFEKEEGGNQEQESQIKEQKENITTRDFANKFFIDYSFEKTQEKDKVKTLTLTNDFQNLTFQEMKEMKNSDEKMMNFLEKIYKENAQSQLSLLKNTLNTILDGKGYHLLESIHKNKLPSMTYGVSITHVQDQLGIFGKLSDTAETNAFGLLDEMKNIFSNDNPLNEEKRKKLGLNTEIFTYITTTNRNIANPEELKKTYGIAEGVDKKKIDEIIDFGSKIQENIIMNPSINFGMGNKMREAFSGQPLSMTESLALYTMLGGKTNFTEMNDIEQSLLILGVNKLLDGGRGDLLQGGYLFTVASAIKNNIEGNASEIQVPQGVINFFSSLGSSLGSFAINYIKDISATSAGFLKESPELMGITALIILLYPVAQRNTLLGMLLPDFKKKLA